MLIYERSFITIHKLNRSITPLLLQTHLETSIEDDTSSIEASRSTFAKEAATQKEDNNGNSTPIFNEKIVELKNLLRRNLEKLIPPGTPVVRSPF